MKKMILLVGLLFCSLSYAHSSIVCGDGNNSNLRVIILLKKEKAVTIYTDKWLPCYVDMYDGYECNPDNPRKFTEETIEVPADLYLVSSFFHQKYRFITLALKRVLSDDSSSVYTIYISEAFGANLDLSISGRIELPKFEFNSGFENDKDGHYVSVNTLYAKGQTQPYYLKCRGLD